jgi:hypothetical protein
LGPSCGCTVGCSGGQQLSRARSWSTLVRWIPLSFLAACQTLGVSAPPLTASLRTDSTQVTVHRSGFNYAATIGFAYTNTTPRPVSKRGCGVTPPELEKKVNGQWVTAYRPVLLMCLRVPDFSIGSGQTYRDALQFMAAEPGHNIGPVLDVDSIDGVYRLRWDLVEGTDAGAKGARIVKSTSNEFRMVLGQ